MVMGVCACVNVGHVPVVMGVCVLGVMCGTCAWVDVGYVPLEMGGVPVVMWDMCLW